MGDAPEKAGKIDENFILLLLQWFVNLGCLIASYAAYRTHATNIGIPVSLALIVFSIVWNIRSIRPNGCIFTLPYLLWVAGFNLLALMLDLIGRR